MALPSCVRRFLYVWREGDVLLLRQMRYFVAVADCRSFTEAAEQCYISQSAISQQIQALEQELGVALLCRQGRNRRRNRQHPGQNPCP